MLEFKEGMNFYHLKKAITHVDDCLPTLLMIIILAAPTDDFIFAVPMYAPVKILLSSLSYYRVLVLF